MVTPRSHEPAFCRKRSLLAGSGVRNPRHARKPCACTGGAFVLLLRIATALGLAQVGLADQLTQGSGDIPSAKAPGSAQPLENSPTDAAYRPTAMRLLLEEANAVARELKLPEGLPITETNLLEAYIPARLVPRRTALVGSLTTSNYTYYVGRGGKVWALARRDFERDRQRLIARYLWPISRLDTNAAYQAAAAVLAAISVDVQGLNRDCRLRVSAVVPEGAGGRHFVPSYMVSWYKDGEDEVVAAVDIFEPTKLLDQLYVIKPEYNHRRKIWVDGPGMPTATNSAWSAPNPSER